jgi:integrase
MPRVTNDGIRKRCDCAKRTWPKCKHPWHVNFHHGGKEHRFSLDVVAKARGVEPPSTKDEAKTLRDQLRGEIRGGKFTVAPTPEPVSTALTFEDVVQRYRERYVNVPTRRESARAMFEVHLNMLLRAHLPAAKGATIELRQKPIDTITKADIEEIRDARRRELAQAKASDAAAKRTRRPGAKGGEVGINRLLARLRHLFSWALREGYIDATPFKRNGVTVIELEHRAETSRQRRLQPGEEAALQEHASEHLRALITAALSTGCRLGELLSLQWGQVQRNAKGEALALLLPAGRTKTNEARVIPVGSRLRAVLEMRRLDPEGEQLPPAAHVFGNGVGEAVTSIRNDWEQACAAAKVEDLHFHDLRREFACRLLESSASLHDVRDFLGHADITTTSTYLKSTTDRLSKALERMEGPAPNEDPADSHTVRTNGPESENGRAEAPAVTH